MDELKRKQAMRLFFAGRSKNFISKKLNVGPYKLNKWIDDTCVDKKKAALHMFFIWFNTKSLICERLDIDMAELEKWIIDKCGGIKEAAVFMYYKFLYPRDRISKELEIPLIKINEWIDEQYRDKDKTIVRFERPKIQEGYSDWVSKIIENSRKAS